MAANAGTYMTSYFLPFRAPNFATVFISWLNLEIGFDICFTTETSKNNIVDLNQRSTAISISCLCH
jgi:hypothetical protein